MVVANTNNILFSAVESRGLGFNVWRGTLHTVDTDSLSSIIENNEVDVAIIRIPAESKNLFLKLQQLGYPTILADVLVYYRLSLGDHGADILNEKSAIELVPFGSQHFTTMDGLIADIFYNYQNHYTANPLLSADIVAAYQEWVKLFNSDSKNGRTAWMAKQDDAYIGFMACEFTNQCCEIRLTGVATEARGRGVFHAMLNQVTHYCVKKGVSTITVSTQLQNYASQKAYAKHGFLMDHAFITVHINSMLSRK